MCVQLNTRSLKNFKFNTEMSLVAGKLAKLITENFTYNFRASVSGSIVGSPTKETGGTRGIFLRPKCLSEVNA